jgi:hypothetical protein
MTTSKASGNVAKIRAIFHVEDPAYGAKGDGTTEDHTAIQAAIDACSTAGGGYVDFNDKTYLIGATLTQPSLVILRGVGSGSTILKAKASLDSDIIRSTNFSTLTGTGAWLTSAGVQHGLGLMNLQIDGNKANQASGDGVKYYAKRIFVQDVIIRDVKGVGWYSEGGDVAGQTDWTDLPESQIEGLWVRSCGSHGFQFRGPHDAHIECLVCNENGGDGARFERSSGVYNGSADIGFAHLYANTAKGLNLPTSAIQCRFRQVISESNHEEGVICAGTYNQFSMLQCYTNCRTSGTYNITITGNQNTISDLQIKDGSESVSGLQITGAKNTVDCFMIDGEASTGVGVDINTGQWNKIRGHVEDYSGVGGTGLRTGNGSALINAHVDVTFTNCATGWNNVQTGSQNTYHINGFAAAGQTFFTGVGPNGTDVSEIWNVRGLDSGGATYRSEIRKISGNVDLNSTTEQEITIACTELLGLTPDPEDVTFGLYYTGTNTTFAIQYLKLHAVSSSALTFRVKLSTAAGGAANGQIIAQVKL